MKLRTLLLGLTLALGLVVQAQDQAPQNWFNLDPTTDGVPGVSTEMMYKKLVKNRKSETVVVAVIDSGVDYEHEDLEDIMWVNPDEIPGNNKDDDNNGYVDDIHGWNFLGNPDGENITYDNLEVTRLYAKYHKVFKDVDPEDLRKKDRKLYDEYKEMEEVIESKQKSMGENAKVYGMVYEFVQKLNDDLGKEATVEEVAEVEAEDPMQGNVLQMVGKLMKEDGMTLGGILDEVESAYKYFDGQANYYYNPDFNPRPLIGDDFSDPYEKGYGNSDVRGPDAGHGTHVAGIIGAVRNNGIGMDGVADNVRIMSVRTVPDGDERDKDVANAIIYAVDNGASIINMSFGKGYSPRKKVVDEAVKYAMKNDVLLVHAAGNDGKENDNQNNFPNDQFEKKGLFGPKYAKNWIEVGALNWEGGEKLPASFSNYSGEYVDLFAPGVDLYSTVPGSEYRANSGTSMAAPVVSGVAAVLRSYFPELTAQQVKDILMESAVPQKIKVVKPGSEDTVSFSSLSVSGAQVNVYKAFEMAAKTKGKKKRKKSASNATNGKNKGKDKDGVAIP